MIIWAIWCIQKHYRVPLSYDLTTFQILGQKLSNFFVGILVETTTPKGHFEINWPLRRISIHIYGCSLLRSFLPQVPIFLIDKKRAYWTVLCKYYFLLHKYILLCMWVLYEYVASLNQICPANLKTFEPEPSWLYQPT